MKKNLRPVGKVLSTVLSFLIILQTLQIPIVALGSSAETGGAVTQNGVLPDVDNSQWEIPEAAENPHDVDMTINNGIVYTDAVYNKLMEWGYLTSYQGAQDPYQKWYSEGYSGYWWRDYTASLGPLVHLTDYRWYNNNKGNWIKNDYVTTQVKRSNTEYGIHKSALTPTLVLGASSVNIVSGKIKEGNLQGMARVSGANLDQATFRIGAVSGSAGYINYTKHDGSYEAILTFKPNSSARIRADINLADVIKQNKEWPSVYMEVDSYPQSMSGIHAVFIDNTSPSIQSVDVTQSGDQLVVTLKTNEGVRWAADWAGEDLDDIWVEVELQVVGTNYTQKVRAHVSGINYRYSLNTRDLSKSDYSNDIVFKGDLGPFADLDYKVLDISNANLPEKDYPITFGKMLMLAMQLNDSRVRNQTLSWWDAETKSTVYETYHTTAICDIAGNPLMADTIINWPINQKEIKNDTTFVRKIELMNDKTLLGNDKPAGDAFPEDITRAQYFFGPNDEIAPRLYLNHVLTDEEVASFRVTTNVKDKSGEYIVLSPTGKGNYYIEYNEAYEFGTGEFMYIDFEPLILTQSMSADAQNGSKAYFEVTKVECELTESPSFNGNIPGPSKTLYLDLSPPKITAKSNSMKEPSPENGYYKLEIELNITDTRIDGMLQAGMLEQIAYFMIKGNINEATPIYYAADASPGAPKDLSGYKSATLHPGEKLKLEGQSVGMTSDDENKAYIHLLIPEKSNLLLNDFEVFADVTDSVGNRYDVNAGMKIEFRIDKQIPNIAFTSSSTVFTATSAITTVKVEATDYNNVEAISYQWVEAGQPYDNEKWESVIIDASTRVTATITKQFSGTEHAKYDVMLYVKCRDDRGNESLIIQRNEKVDIDKPTGSYEVISDLSSPSTHPEITVKGPEQSSSGKTGYTRITISPINPRENWNYVTVIKSGEELDVFDFDENKDIEWYRVSISGSYFVDVKHVDGEDVTLDDLKKYYGNVKIGFEHAYMDLTPVSGYIDDTVTDGSYIADQNYLTARFASQDGALTGVNNVSFGKVTAKDGEMLSSSGQKGADSLFFSTSLRGVNAMRGVSLYFDISNVKMSDWGLLDMDFENSTIELLRSDENTTDELIYLQNGIAQSNSQYFTIPDYTMNDGWFETGVYRIRVTIKSRSGSVDVFESLNIVYDAGTPINDGVVSYSHDLRYETGSYRTMYSGDPVSSFGIAVHPGREISRNNVFAVYRGGVTGFSFTLSADNTKAEYDGFAVGEIEGFRYWNSLSAPTAEDLEGYEFSKYARSEDPCLVVTSGVESIYTEATIPKGADALGDIYLVEGVNTICYQVKMSNGYVSPVKQFTIIVTQYVPEFNVIVDDYTPSYYAAQRDGQVNAHDITMKIEEAFSLNGSGNVNVEVWSNYAMVVNGEWVPQTEANSQTLSLTCLKSGLKAGDTAVLTEDSYTSCFPPYSGQGNQCSAVFVAIDEYGGMAVYAPQIGAKSRLNDPSDPYDDLISIDYYGSSQDDPFVIGRDISFIEIYNEAVYFGRELIGFQNLRSSNGGDYVVVETSVPQLQYNLFAISSNNVVFSPFQTSWAGDHKTISATWEVSNGELQNYEIIDWNNTTVSFYDENGGVLAEGLDVWNPGTNSAGFIGGNFGEAYDPYSGERWTQFYLDFANPKATAEHPAYDWSKNYWDEVNLNSQMRVYFTMKGINVFGDEFETEGAIDLRYIDYGDVTQTLTESGIVLELPFVSADGESEIYTGVFNGEGDTYAINVTDAFGNKHTISGTYKVDNFDAGTEITFSHFYTTSEPVVITLKRNDGSKLYVDVTDAAIISVVGNGTSDVTITVTDSIRLGYKYQSSDGTIVSKMLTVGNIVKPNPKITVDVNTDIVLEDENGTRYRYGNVVIRLVDDYFTLTDIYTGLSPSFTFVPGGVTTYTFSKDEIVAALGDEAAISIPSSLTYTLDFELREVIDPLMEIVVNDAPSLKINAFREDRGYHEDTKLDLVIQPAGVEDTIVEDEEGVTLKYAGKRVNASSFLAELGWANGYRFLIETVSGSGYRIFIKQGLYQEAPDFETGMSDEIDGVILNGRLLTVEKNAQFTLFAVASNGNYTSVAFDVINIGNAPKPTTVKVPIDDKTVKVYIIAPEGVSDFTATPADAELVINTDPEGDYAGVPYVEYDKNDDYVINYSFTYNGETVNGELNTSVYEIRIREMKQNGTISWSANKTFESTDKNISASLSFSELISAVEVVGGSVDKSKVQISYSGKQLTVRFSDNHAEFTLKIRSAYGDVTASIDGVDNIDREAPIVKELKEQRRLSADGKKVTITITTNERTVFREGGYVGEQSKDENGNEIYVYTREITENGSYTYTFTDMSGIASSVTVVIDEIVTEELEVLFSKDKNRDNAVADASKLVLNYGDKVYVTATKDATVSYNGQEGIKVKKDEWLEITLDDGVDGASPYVTVTDDYGGIIIRQFSQIIPRDTEAPIITIKKTVVTIVAGSDRAEAERLLLENITAVDQDDNLTYSVKFAEDISVSGSVTATYTVTDSAGNSASAECRLRIMSGSEPEVSIDGTQIYRDESYYAEAGKELTLMVDVEGQPYCVYIESGIKTVAQMKIGSTNVTDGYVKDATVELGTLESGFYTLVIQTQSRDYFRIIIYVY